MNLRAGARRCLLYAARFSGALAAWRHFTRQSVVILTLHGVMDEADGPVGWRPLRPRMSRAALDRALRLLKRRYRFVRLAAALDMLAGRAPIRPNSLAITFDDGYRNNLTHAAPVLQRHGAAATLFVASGLTDERRLFLLDRLDYVLQRLPDPRIELAVDDIRLTARSGDRAEMRESFTRFRDTLKARCRDDERYRAQLGRIVEECEQRAGASLLEMRESDPWTSLARWDELRDGLRRYPGLEIGSHTHNHARLARVSDDIARAELRRSRALIRERLGVECDTFSYPNGSFNARVAAMVREEGYRAAVTTQEGLNQPGAAPMTLRRIGLPAECGKTDLLARASGFSQALSEWRGGRQESDEGLMAGTPA